MPRPGSHEDLLERYIAARRAQGLARSSEAQHRLALTRFFTFLRERRVRDLRAVGPDHVVAFMRLTQTVKSERGIPYARVTLENWLGALRGFLAYLVRQRLALVNAADYVRLPRQKTLPRRILTVEQARRLVETPTDTRTGIRDRAVLEVLYGCGLRARECVQIDVDDVDLAASTLFIRQAKGKKDRVVPIPARAAEALTRYLREARPQLTPDPRERACFISWRSGSRITVAGIQLLVQANARRAGIPFRVGPHALRHSCATHLLRGGADVRHVQKLLGHKDLNSTMIYTRVFPADLKDAIARAHPRERQKRP